jgi:hypothetical protein
MDILESFDVKRLDFCELGFDLDDEPTPRRPNGGFPSSLPSPSVAAGDFSVIRQQRGMVEHKKTRVQFIAPLEEEDALKSIKLTPRNIAGGENAAQIGRHTIAGASSENFEYTGSDTAPHARSLASENSEGQLVRKSSTWLRSWTRDK